VGPVLLAGLLLGLSVSNWVQFGTFGLSVESQFETIEFFYRSPGSMEFYWDDWLRRPLVLIPLGIVGFFVARFARFDRLALGVLCLVPVVYFFTWGVPERGGHFLGTAPFYGVLVAAGMSRWRLGRPVLHLLVVALLIAQSAMAAYIIHDADRGWGVDDRVEVMREHVGPDGMLVTCVDAPPLRIFLPEVEEMSLWLALSEIYRNNGLDVPHEDIVRVVLPPMRRVLRERGRAVYDLGYRTQKHRLPVQYRLPFYDHFEKVLEREFKTRVVDHPWWPVMILEQK